MPRPPRYFIPGIPQHVLARGNDRQAVFWRDDDYQLYLRALRKASTKYECQIHAYVLMTNHVHLLVTPERKRSLPSMMQDMGRAYVQRLNFRYRRSGTLWEGRYKASVIQTDEYLLACQRYIELNPVRAGMVGAPGHYRYSSFHHHALGSTDRLLTPHATYLAIHADPAARRRAYRALFSDALSADLLLRLRHETHVCGVIGSDSFKEQIAATTGRPVPTGKRGRPKSS